jgi:hypothetical protein
MARRAGRKQADRLGHLARFALLRLRDPRRAGQVLLRLARRADRLHGQFKNSATGRGSISTSTGKPDSTAELYHFIGKDILYFHALFWPAELEHAGYRTPTKRLRHGFLTVDGAKMSKSRGTFITAESYLAQGLNPEWLRYYYAAKLNGSMEDIDLNLEDFIARVNSDLVGKYVNIASRSRRLHRKRFAGQLDPRDHGPHRPRQSVRRQRQALGTGPQEGRASELQAACSNSLNLFRLLPFCSSRSCRRWRQGRSLPQRRSLCLGRRGTCSPPGTRSTPIGTC